MYYSWMFPCCVQCASSDAWCTCRTAFPKVAEAHNPLLPKADRQPKVYACIMCKFRFCNIVLMPSLNLSMLMQRPWCATHLPPHRADRRDIQRPPWGDFCTSHLRFTEEALHRNLCCIFQLFTDSEILLQTQKDQTTRLWLHQMLHNIAMASSGRGGSHGPHADLNRIMGRWMKLDASTHHLPRACLVGSSSPRGRCCSLAFWRKNSTSVVLEINYCLAL
jgi:hypothetical protein